MSSLLKTLVFAGALVIAVANAHANQGDTTPDAAVSDTFIKQIMGDATMAGAGQMRFFGLLIYDARLWVGPRFEAAAFDTHSLALELTYHRAFTGMAIAQRSIEEINRQGTLSPTQAQYWQQTLAALLPDVQPGDRLMGLYQPGQGMRLWRGTQSLGFIEDAELARRFFGIWLSPRTSEPRLRKALLGQHLGAMP